LDNRFEINFSDLVYKKYSNKLLQTKLVLLETKRKCKKVFRRMSLILRRSYQLVPKELTKNTKLPKVFRKKHEDPAKNIRAEIKQLKKHEKIFDEFGFMRKLTATLATECGSQFFTVQFFCKISELLSCCDPCKDLL